MNPIRKKLADLLTKMSQKGLSSLDPKSPCARKIKKVDREKLLKEDITRICQEIGMMEATRLLSLSAKLSVASNEEIHDLKMNIRTISTKVVDRVEKKTGKLNFPVECRNLLLSL